MTLGWSTVSKTGHFKGIKSRGDWSQRKSEQHNIPKGNPKTPLSDPETPLIAHSLKERDKTEEEFRKRERKIKSGGEWLRGVKGPFRHLKSLQDQTYPSPKNQEQSHTFHKWPLTYLNTCSRGEGLPLLASDSQMSVCIESCRCRFTYVSWFFVFMPQNVGKMCVYC